MYVDVVPDTDYYKTHLPYYKEQIKFWRSYAKVL